MKNFLKSIAKNIWWIILWYLINVAFYIQNQGVFDWKVIVIGAVTATGIIVFTNREKDPRTTPFT